jgi:hypothetical protein
MRHIWEAHPYKDATAQCLIFSMNLVRPLSPMAKAQDTSKSETASSSVFGQHFQKDVGPQ